MAKTGFEPDRPAVHAWSTLPQFPETPQLSASNPWSLQDQVKAMMTYIEVLADGNSGWINVTTFDRDVLGEVMQKLSFKGWSTSFRDESLFYTDGYTATNHCYKLYYARPRDTGARTFEDQVRAVVAYFQVLLRRYDLTRTSTWLSVTTFNADVVAHVRGRFHERGWATQWEDRSLYYTDGYTAPNYSLRVHFWKA